MAIQSTIMLNNGTVIPQVGLAYSRHRMVNYSERGADGSEMATAISIPQ